MLFCCLRRNVNSCCNKYFVHVPVNNKRRRLPAVSVTSSQLATVRRRPVDITWRSIRSQRAMEPDIAHSWRRQCFYLSHLHSTSPLGGRGGWGLRQNIAMPFSMKKTRMVGLRDGEKILKMITRFDRIHERDGQTDRHTHTA